MNTIQRTAVQPNGSADWQARYRAPAIYWAQIAGHAPDRGLVATSRDGFVQLYTWDIETASLRQLTNKPEGQVDGVLSPDGQHVYYLQDKDGDEVGHFVRIPYTGGEVEDLTPDLPPYSPLYIDFTRSGNLLVLGYVDEAKQECFSTLPLTPEGRVGEPRLLYKSSSMIEDCALSPNGDLAVISTNERSQSLHFSLIALKTATLEVIAELWDGAETSIEPAFFSPVAGDNRLLATTTKSGYRRPFLWNPVTGERNALRLDSIPGEIVPVTWSNDGNTLLLRQFAQAQQRIYRYDLHTHTLTTLDHPAGTYDTLFFRSNGEIFANWQDAQNPAQIICLDGETGTKLGVVLQAGAVPAGRAWRSIQFPSLDGTPIQAWLATPAGEGPFPMIIETHGGPTEVQTEIFSPPAQSWLDNGFAYLSVNYRGSTTFGREYQDKILGALGHWEVEDIVGARRWLIEQGIANPGEIFLTGWSYGGYLTLQTMGKYPGLWTGGMAGVAPGDLRTMYEDAADPMRAYLTGLLGGTPTEKPDAYVAASPITYAAQVDAPILIIQGRNDSRTPARPIVEYEAKMRTLGKAIEVVWYESGHTGSFTNREQGIAHQALMLDFAQRILQEG